MNGSWLADVGAAGWQKIRHSAQALIYGPEQSVDPVADCPHAKTCGGGCCAKYGPREISSNV